MSIAVLDFQNKGEEQKLLRYLLVPSWKPKVFIPAGQDYMNNSAWPLLCKSSIRNRPPATSCIFKFPRAVKSTASYSLQHRKHDSRWKISLGCHSLRGRIHKGTISTTINYKQDWWTDGEASVLEDPRATYVVHKGNFLQYGQALLSGGEMQ